MKYLNQFDRRLEEEQNEETGSIKNNTDCNWIKDKKTIVDGRNQNIMEIDYLPSSNSLYYGAFMKDWSCSDIDEFGFSITITFD